MKKTLPVVLLTTIFSSNLSYSSTVDDFNSIAEFYGKFQGVATYCSIDKTMIAEFNNYFMKVVSRANGLSRADVEEISNSYNNTTLKYSKIGLTDNQTCDTFKSEYYKVNNLIKTGKITDLAFSNNAQTENYEQGVETVVNGKKNIVYSPSSDLRQPIKYKFVGVTNQADDNWYDKFMNYIFGTKSVN